MLVLGEHGLIDAAVEAAKLDPHSWQAAKLRSVGGALGGLRSAAAALCFQLASEELPRRRCPVRATVRQTVARFASIHGSIAEPVSEAIVLVRLSQCLMQVFVGSIHCFYSLLRFMDWVHSFDSLLLLLLLLLLGLGIQSGKSM